MRVVELSKSRLICVGITHKTAPPEIRGRFQFTTEQQRTLLDDLAAVAIERAVLGTCGRFEVYAVVAPGSAGGDAVALAARHRDGKNESVATDVAHRIWERVVRLAGGPDDVSSHVRFDAGYACAEHLLRVAAGLESRVVGERQILDQTRSAFLMGCEAGAVGPVLSALFRTAIHTGRRVRCALNVDDRDRSVAWLAVDRVAAECNGVRDSEVVVVGGGRMARDVAGELAARRAGRLVIMNRSLDAADRIARAVRASAVPLDDLTGGLASADAVIVCTASSSFVLDRSSIGRRCGRSLSIVDLSVPRNVDPIVEWVPGVRLTHLDGLVRSGDGAALDDDRAACVIDDQLCRFRRWLAARSVAPAIRTMVGSVDSGDPTETASRRRALHGPIVRLVENVAA